MFSHGKGLLTCRSNQLLLFPMYLCYRTPREGPRSRVLRPGLYRIVGYLSAHRLQRKKSGVGCHALNPRVHGQYQKSTSTTNTKRAFQAVSNPQRTEGENDGVRSEALFGAVANAPCLHHANGDLAPEILG